MNKTLKVLMLNGSPRKNGNIALAFREMEQVFAENGIETENILLGRETIRGCIACETCRKNKKCVFDDIVNELAVKFEAADGLVIGSPVYYGSANGTLMSALQRLFYSTSFDKSMKVGASVVSARRSGCTATFDELNKFFTQKQTRNKPQTGSGQRNESQIRNLCDRDRWHSQHTPSGQRSAGHLHLRARNQRLSGFPESWKV